MLREPAASVSCPHCGADKLVALAAIEAATVAEGVAVLADCGERTFIGPAEVTAALAAGGPDALFGCVGCGADVDVPYSDLLECAAGRGVASRCAGCGEWIGIGAADVCVALAAARDAQTAALAVPGGGADGGFDFYAGHGAPAARRRPVITYPGQRAGTPWSVPGTGPAVPYPGPMEQPGTARGADGWHPDQECAGDARRRPGGQPGSTGPRSAISGTAAAGSGRRAAGRGP